MSHRYKAVYWPLYDVWTLHRKGCFFWNRVTHLPLTWANEVDENELADGLFESAEQARAFAAFYEEKGINAFYEKAFCRRSKPMLNRAICTKL